MKFSISYDHWSLRKWRIKIGKVIDFLRQKSVFFCENILMYPMQLGCLGALSSNPLLLSSLKEVVCSEPSRNGSCAYVFGARAERDCPYGDVFFFADFVTCANFSNLCRKFLKTHNRYGHHVSAKSCAGSWATFSSKKNFEKNSASWFFLKRSFEKTLILTIFYV